MSDLNTFGYTPDALFDCVAKLVAHPHTVITDHDKARAMAIFLTFADYLGNCAESDYTDFEGFVMEKLGNEDYKKEVSVEELLK